MVADLLDSDDIPGRPLDGLVHFSKAPACARVSIKHASLVFETYCPIPPEPGRLRPLRPMLMAMLCKNNVVLSTPSWGTPGRKNGCGRLGAGFGGRNRMRVKVVVVMQRPWWLLQVGCIAPHRHDNGRADQQKARTPDRRLVHGETAMMSSEARDEAPGMLQRAAPGVARSCRCCRYMFALARVGVEDRIGGRTCRSSHLARHFASKQHALHDCAHAYPVLRGRFDGTWSIRADLVLFAALPIGHSPSSRAG